MGESSAEVGLLLVGNSRMQRLNRHYRGTDRPTDVLAFAMREKGNSSGRGRGSRRQKKIGGSRQPPTGLYPLLGDVVVSVPMARKQAREQGHPLDWELKVLIIHGLLHLLGYDHESSPAAARVMRRKEKKLLRAFTMKPVLAQVR
jgi:rRNA maturation RNase YbeY